MSDLVQALGPLASAAYGGYDFFQRQSLENQMSPQNVMSSARSALTPQVVSNLIQPVLGQQMDATGGATPGLLGQGVGTAVSSALMQMYNQILNSRTSQLNALGQPPDLPKLIAQATGGTLTGNNQSGSAWAPPSANGDLNAVDAQGYPSNPYYPTSDPGWGGGYGSGADGLGPLAQAFGQYYAGNAGF